MKAQLKKWIAGVKLEVFFSYSEREDEVSKVFSIRINGEKSNWIGLKRYLEIKEKPYILSANTYHWKSIEQCEDAFRNEKKRMFEVIDFFQRENFELVEYNDYD